MGLYIRRYLAEARLVRPVVSLQLPQAGFYYELLYNTSFSGSQVASSHYSCRPCNLAGCWAWCDQYDYVNR